MWRLRLPFSGHGRGGPVKPLNTLQEFDERVQLEERLQVFRPFATPICKSPSCQGAVHVLFGSKGVWCVSNHGSGRSGGFPKGK